MEKICRSGTPSRRSKQVKATDNVHIGRPRVGVTVRYAVTDSSRDHHHRRDRSTMVDASSSCFCRSGLEIKSACRSDTRPESSK